MLDFLGKLLDSNEREINKLKPFVEGINSLEKKFSKLTDKQLAGKFSEFKLAHEKGATLDELLPEAFACVREAAKRTIKQRHFDVQMMAAITLHQGKIAEQKTGEGKTLSATPALFFFAVVDEVDSILIDEARTPLIISQPAQEATQKYYEFAKIIDSLSPSDYVVDEKQKTAHLTEHGTLKIEKMLGVDNLYEKDFSTLHHLEESLKAKTLFQKDKDYVVKDGEVIIVDEFTGRLMMGRRYSEGLHQAIEAKEGVPIQQESQTLATISFQNYFRMYQKLAGMTGTATTEAEEFAKIYSLDVVTIPTNNPMVRIDHADTIYKTIASKYTAVANLIEELHQKGQPVLVGTTSIDKNEFLSDLLKKKGISHALLNAKNHEKEAEIISSAGEKGSVTVATNMAGRGVDIILGKNVDKLGGLYVIGTERHESRRIDNQLRGRSGRQGDFGETRFFVSLEDDLMRIFGGEQVSKVMDFLKMPEDLPIEHGLVSKAIEGAQKKVEGHNFDIRKHTVEYEDVMNQQRKIIYEIRKKVLETAESKDTSLKEEILQKIEREISTLVTIYSEPELD